MNSYFEPSPLWDLPHTSSFPQITDDEFLALLQKQFVTTPAVLQANFVDGVNPQNISRYPLPSLTPPSEDSSPSPPNLNQETGGADDIGDAILKRKAEVEDTTEGPSQKTPHTSPDTAHKKSVPPNRKKSITGTTPKDENRLLKRKEQNRAAQRAFRERKEKHVKDLEDKVAALEAKNEQAVHENENLRDLLGRLQAENVALKQASFTFTVPKNASEGGQASTSFAAQASEFASTSRSSSSPASAVKPAGSLDWNSLTAFDPAMLSILDDQPQPTATEGARQMDFGFGTGAGLTSTAPLTTIASNPMFMSYASEFDSVSPLLNTGNGNNSFFDMNTLSWSPPVQPQDSSSSLDELFSGYMSRGLDYSVMNTPLSHPTDSPVSHHGNLNYLLTSQPPASSSSPSSSTSDPLLENKDNSTVSDLDNGHAQQHDGCPRTKGEMAKRIEMEGLSPFASNLHKSDGAFGTVINCTGTTLPKTQKSDANVEVLSAWRSITSNPMYRDVDIDRLCTEFTSKAKCDGTKVVLEPQGVDSIIKNLSSSASQQ